MSEREQEYLDLAVALSTSPSLEGVLQESYIEQELLEGANQYRCEKCGKLVDAKRVRVALLNDRLLVYSCHSDVHFQSGDFLPSLW